MWLPHLTPGPKILAKGEEADPELEGQVGHVSLALDITQRLKYQLLGPKFWQASHIPLHGQRPLCSLSTNM
jgi:hypothetical protein